MATPNSSKQRTLDEMIHASTGNGDHIVCDISSTDYQYTGTAKIKGIIIADGTVLKLDKKNSDASTVTMYVPAPGIVAIDGVTKIYKTGTDATLITLVTE